MKKILSLLIVSILVAFTCVGCKENVNTSSSEKVNNFSYTIDENIDSSSKVTLSGNKNTTSSNKTNESSSNNTSSNKTDSSSSSGGNISSNNGNLSDNKGNSSYNTNNQGESSNNSTVTSSETSSKQETAHKHSYSSQAVAATCSKGGYTLYSCECGDSYKDNITLPNYNHNFKFADSSQIDYICSKCNVMVCEQGKADGSYGSGGLPVKYYITGSATSNGISRTLVIYGQGKMPDFKTGYIGEPMWEGMFIYDVNKIIIADGITSIGKYSFYNENCYSKVKRIEIADTVKDIYSYGLYGITKLSPKQMIIGNGVTHIYSNSLPKSGFSVQYFPKSLQYIDEDYNFSIFTYYQGTEEEYFNIKIQHGPYVNSYITMRELKKIIEDGGSSFIMPFCNVKLNSNNFVDV